MTNEEKELRLRDLCARLYTGTIVNYNDTEGCDYKLTIRTLSNFPDENLKCYLRPMSSMTKEEKNELRNLLWFGYPSDDYDNNSHRGIEVKQCLYDDERYSTYDFDDFRALQNFLLKKHFDYCGLIEKGLALEAPEGMYNIK